MTSKKLIAFAGSTLVTISGFAQDRPNILWLTTEDMSANHLSCYGNVDINTPNIDAFSRNSRNSTVSTFISSNLDIVILTYKRHSIESNCLPKNVHPNSSSKPFCFNISYLNFRKAIPITLIHNQPLIRLENITNI